MTDILDLVRRADADAGGTASALGILLRVTVLLLAAMLVALALRRSSAALRHLVWTLSLVGTLLIPLCYWAFPAWHWAILPQRQPVAAAVDRSRRAKTAPSPEVAPSHRHVLSASPHSPTSAAGRRVFRSSRQYRRRAVAEHPTVAPCASTDVVLAGCSLPSFGPWELFWGSFGWGSALRRPGMLPGVPDLPRTRVGVEILQQLLAPCGLRRPIEVRECPQVSVPMTWGLRRPVILVPAGSAAWSEETKRSVLLHELGHIRRGDCLMLLLGRLACVAYWFHPLVWLAARQLRQDQRAGGRRRGPCLQHRAAGLCRASCGNRRPDARPAFIRPRGPAHGEPFRSRRPRAGHSRSAAKPPQPEAKDLLRAYWLPPRCF